MASGKGGKSGKSARRVQRWWWFEEERRRGRGRGRNPASGDFSSAQTCSSRGTVDGERTEGGMTGCRTKKQSAAKNSPRASFFDAPPRVPTQSSSRPRASLSCPGQWEWRDLAVGMTGREGEALRDSRIVRLIGSKAAAQRVVRGEGQRAEACRRGALSLRDQLSRGQFSGQSAG